jgi:hypothetical protein
MESKFPKISKISKIIFWAWDFVVFREVVASFCSFLPEGVFPVAFEAVFEPFGEHIPEGAVQSPRPSKGRKSEPQSENP